MRVSLKTMKIDKINNNLYPLKSTSRIVRVENKMGKFCQLNFCCLFLMKSSIGKLYTMYRKFWIKKEKENLVTEF